MCLRLFIITHLILTVASFDFNEGFISSSFLRTQRCFSQNCTVINQGVRRSDLECLSLCSLDNSCGGVQFNGIKECVHLKENCLQNATCHNSSSSVEILEKNPCNNNGTWVVASRKCICTDSMVGSTCERYPYSCKDLLTQGYATGLYRVTLDIYKDLSFLVQTYCYITTSSQTYLTYILRSNGLADRNKTWAEYVRGYMIGEANLWVGLEAMVRLNRMNYTVVGSSITVKSSLADGGWARRNPSFSISDASFGYNYSCASLIGETKVNNLTQFYTPGDILYLNKGSRFSTSDNDNDGVSGQNCASAAGTGWWFNNCNLDMNPLGWNYPANSGNGPEGHIAIPGLNFSDPVLNMTLSLLNMFFMQP